MAPFTRLHVQDFQSIAEADLELGGFTVIVGPSNSGKSAVLRAMRAVARNVSSPAAVRAGKKMFSVALSSADSTVAVERGKAHSTYRLIEDGDEKIFTKAGRSVPEEILRALQLREPDGPDVVFSTQIDPPFLLAETGSMAAKMLGDLTNVSKLHAAAREANKRRLDASRMRKVREDDAAKALERLKEVAPGLKERGERLSEARTVLAGMRTKADQCADLRHTLAALREAESRLATITVPPEPANALGELAEVEWMLDKSKKVRATLARIAGLDRSLEGLPGVIESAAKGIETLDSVYHETLVEAGTCPTCGQTVDSAAESRT